MSTVELAIDGAIARLTINRADKHNALTQAMWQQVANYCEILKGNPSVRVLIVASTGQKAFSADADIGELTEIIKDKERLVANNAIVQKAQQILESLPFATIAAINGVCFGGGTGLALCCDFRIAVSHAKFAITPAKLGLLYSIEDTRRVVNLIGAARTKELLYTGQTIAADKALSWGMLTQVVAEDELEKSVDELAINLLNASGQSIAGVKQTIAFIEQQSDKNDKAINVIRALFDNAFSSDDFTEGANAFIEKRAAKFHR